MNDQRNNTIAIDMMGGDHGLVVTIPAVKQILELYPQLSLQLVGQIDQFQSDFANCSQVTCVNATEQVTMDENPVYALKHLKDSSIHNMARLVAEGQAQVGVSAANTGALVAICKYIIKTLPNIKRPGLMAKVPTMIEKDIWMVDLGANLELSAKQYLQFAIMGSNNIYQVIGTVPNIGLLNIGTEAMKGPAVLQKANQLLQDNEAESNYNYLGNVEPTEIFTGKYDLIVCDGLMGNIALKTTEGTIKFLGTYLKKEINVNTWTKLSGYIAKPMLKNIKNYINPSARNGALLIGLNKPIIKSHGGCNVEGFVAAIKCAIQQL